MRQSCRDFVDEVVLPFIKQNWKLEWSMVPEERLPPRILEEAEKIGIRTLGVPEEYGGVELEKGTEVRTFAMIAGEIARGDSGLADKLVQNWKVSVLLRQFAPKHLQEKWFKRLVADPQFLMAHCLTEPRGASDRWLPYNVPEAAMQTKAVKTNGGWVINGRKQFISNGYDAGLYVVYANTNTKVGMMQGTSSFLVPRETKGFSVARCNETLGCRFMNNGEMVFEDMFIPDDQLLVKIRALGSAGVYFRPGKIIQAAKNLGVGIRAFEATADYVQNYVQGGRILIKHQAVALRLADMATRIEAVRALLDRASQAVDDNAPDAEILVNMAKMFASEEIMKVAQHAVELHGGNGIMLDFGIEKVLRDAVIFLHMDATVDISKFKIIKNMFPETAGKYAGPEDDRSFQRSSPRKRESHQHNQHAGELREARNHAEREEADNHREHRHQRREVAARPPPSSDDGVREQIDRQRSGEPPCTTTCRRFSNQPMLGQPLIADDREINRREYDQRNRADRLDCARARHVPKPKQSAERRPEQSGGGEQQIAADALPADRRERLRAEHQKADDNRRAADDALEGRLFVQHQRGEDQSRKSRASRLDGGAMTERHQDEAGIGKQRLRRSGEDAHHKAAAPADATEVAQAVAARYGIIRSPDQKNRCNARSAGEKPTGNAMLCDNKAAGPADRRPAPHNAPIRTLDLCAG